MAIQLINGYVLLPAPADWSEGAEIVLAWQTGIALAQQGNEDRAGLRALPEAQMAWRVVTDTPEDRAELEDQVRAALRSGKACAPCYARPCYVVPGAGEGAQIFVEPTQWPWAAGDYLFAIGNDGSTACVQVEGVNGTQLTLAAAIQPGRVVWPVLFGRLETEKPEQEAPDTLSLGCRLYVPQWKLPVASVAPAGYLGTPIIPITTDWSENVERTFGYDAQVQQIGYGAETLENEQSWVQHGVTLTTLLRTDSAISDVEAFLGVVGGRRGNFWLVSHERAMLIITSQSLSTFTIQAQDLVDAWNDQPAIYLAFYKQGRAPMFNTISAVAAVDAATEKVTLALPLKVPVDATWDVYLLRLVRLADDELKEEYEADGLASVRLTLIEMPLEYGQPLVAPQPAYLYQFVARLDATLTWYQTSHAQAITVAGNTWTPEPISHADIQRSMKSTDESVKVTTQFSADSPLAAFLPFPPSDRFQLTIWRYDLGSPNVAPAVEFQGFISQVRMQGRKLEATVQSPIDFMDRKLPTYFVGYLCNARLYGPGCNLNMADWAVAGQIAALAGTGVSLATDPGKPKNYFAGGHLDVGEGRNRELRTIMASNGLALVLNYPLLKAAVGNTLTLYPGCAHNPSDCQTKFNNWVNYQGHPLVPFQNPTLTAINVSGAGGKK